VPWRPAIRLIPWLLAAAFGLPASAPAPHAPGPSGRQSQSASASPSESPNPRKARQSFEKGLRDQQQEDWQAALEDFARACELAPANREYLFARDLARGRLVREYVERADRDTLAERLPEARAELHAAIALDPGDPIARERLDQLDAPAPGPVREVNDELAGEIRIHPQPGTHRFDYRGDIQGAYQEIARQFGVTAAFDVDLHARPVRLRIEDVDFAVAMSVLGDITHTFWSPLNSRMFFVADDTPQKRKDYQASVVRTLLLPASVSNEQMTEMLRVVREVAEITRSGLDTRTHTLTLRATPAAIALAKQLVEELELPRAEMILEIEILEVDRDVARELGITPPQSSSIVALNKQDLLQAQQSIQGLISVITRLFGQPASLSGLGTNQISALISAGQLSASSLIPPLVAFGGGGSSFLATLPGAAAHFSDTLSLIHQGQRVLLRAQDGRPVTFFVGDRFPITLGQFSASLVPSQFVPGITPSSFPRTDFATGKGPVSVVSADFNGDGKIDLAVANQTDDTVSILLGDGHGNFTATSTPPATGKGPIALVAADFNGDGKIDLAVVNQTDNTVSILLGNGDGTFAPKVDFNTGIMPDAIVAGKFNTNKDTNLGLAIANHTDDTVSILLGDGHGNFTPKTPSPATGKGPMSLAAGDFNGDSKLDLAVANNTDNTVSILLGNGDGTFTLKSTLATGNGPVSVAAADFNLDSRLDLAVANNTDDTVSIMLGNGDGTFGAKTDFATGKAPAAVATGDFNLDGLPDLAVVNNVDSTVSILLGNGDGTFAPQFTFVTGTGPVALTAADLNGDGTIDLAIADQTANAVTVILNQSSFVAPGSVSSQQASGQQPFPNSEYEDIGLKIETTPRVHANDEVTLKLKFEIRSLSGKQVNGIPVIHNREIEQTLRLRENETAALAGILSHTEMRAINGLPFLSNLGIASYLFSDVTTDQPQDELLVLVTPRLVRFTTKQDKTHQTGHAPSSASPATLPPGPVPDQQ
jgi:type II secretory pathway component GspD/PulD (secretin)